MIMRQMTTKVSNGTHLYREGCVIAGSLGTKLALHTFKLARELPNRMPDYFTYLHRA